MNRAFNRVRAITRMSKASGATQHQCRAAFEALEDGIREALDNGERVEFREFLGMRVKVRAQRPARNPRTGEKITIPPRRKVSVTVYPGFWK